jgi:hypothetical protein
MHRYIGNPSHICKWSCTYTPVSGCLHSWICLTSPLPLRAHPSTIRAAYREQHRRIDVCNCYTDTAIQLNSCRISTTSTAPSLHGDCWDILWPLLRTAAQGITSTAAPPRELVACDWRNLRVSELFQIWDLTIQHYFLPLDIVLSTIIAYSFLLIRQRHSCKPTRRSCQLWMRPYEKKEKRSSTRLNKSIEQELSLSRS